ncbi:hypothetical protein [Flavihumibacter fluvii]|uniref:hypothetical protein n=1 Tax=Flavihumibacter fluvii TaxID=2838157 RepID=UPI001BDF5C8E|nr:hypothetical protein [Flavihumibacter fluvii]ULQ52087.1 hypothetical protein KJS93_18500 [Flavihumibacter fluvii]
MKTILLLYSFFLFLLPATEVAAQPNATLSGAWQNASDPGETICMMDGYFVYAKFDIGAKTFEQTWGGPYSLEGNNLKIKVEFDSKEKDQVGKERVLPIKKTATLTIDGLGAAKTMKQVDDGKGPLAGNWRITGRKQGETMNEIPLRPRRTLKLLTGTRFQWMAINIETGEFSGTGGGTYTFANGKYTEHIEFFSRDGNRVGASLSFDGKIENGDWHHSGLSSKGDPIYEIWSRMK